MSSRFIHSLPARGGGGGGPSTPARQTTYVQTFAVPDTTWTVTHPLGSATPMVALYDMSGHAIDDADVFAPDNSTVIVSFALPFAGKVVLQA